MKVAWDETKNLANQAKHGVSFEEASALFSSGDEYLEIFDEAHSEEEERRGVVLVVWTEQDEDTTRIISARWATKRERAHYEAFMENQR